MSTSAKLMAEFVGTFCLVFLGCAAALLSAHLTAPIGIGYLGVGLAFGLTVMVMAFAIGHISGCHLNPAVSIGLCAANRFRAAELPGYIASQLLGGLAGAVTLYFIIRGQSGFTPTSVGTFASNGYGAEGSPANFSWLACFMAETIFTGIFIFIIVGSTSDRAPKGFAPIAIGLGLTLLHLGLIPITNCSLNPARSTATALVAAAFGSAKSTIHTLPVQQLWLFWLAPILGGVLGGLFYRFIEIQGEAVAPVKKSKAEPTYSSSGNEPERFDVGSAPPPMPKPTEHKTH